MDVGSAGAGSISHNVPTQTGSQQQINRAEQQENLEVSPSQESVPQQGNERVGSVINTTA